jgi:transposase InsO family protein
MVSRGLSFQLQDRNFLSNFRIATFRAGFLQLPLEETMVFHIRPEDRLLKLTQAFSLVDAGSMSLKEAAMTAGYSYWHLTRLYKKALTQGIDRLYAPRPTPKPRKLTEQDIALLKQHYEDLEHPQLSLLMYFLQQDHPSFPAISEEWARKLLIRERVYSPDPRRKIFRRRFEAPAPGVLVQGDSTPMQWIPGDNTYYQFIAFLDDCTRLCLGAALVEHDSVIEHFRLLKSIVRRWGRFVALYYDNDEKYRYIRHHQSRHYTYHTDEADLQVVRALSELGISIINSKLYDPCGKGKIERFIGTAELQLPVWFRRYGVKDLATAAPVLGRYLGYYNSIRVHRELGCPPLQKFRTLAEQSRFTKPGADVDLNRVFSYRYWRRVDRANTIRFEGAEYQLEPDRLGRTYCGKPAEVRYLPGRPVRIYINGELVRSRRLLTLTIQKPPCHTRPR